MNTTTPQSLNDSPREGSRVRGALVIVLAGLALGLTYNTFGLLGRPAWGLSWVAKDAMERLEDAGTVRVDDEASSAAPLESYTTDLDDPLAIPAPLAPQGLPEIPAVGRPVKIEIGALKLYYDAAAALVVDARDPEDYAEGHIRGAINLPYDLVVSDPALVETLDTAGRPVVTYCGGGGCEVSVGVAEELSLAGFERVAVYVGGFGEWEGAGYPVGRGEVAP